MTVVVAIFAHIFFSVRVQALKAMAFLPSLSSACIEAVGASVDDGNNILPFPLRG